MVCLWVFARVLVLRWQAGGVCLVAELLSCKCEAGCCVSDLCLHRVAGVSVFLPPACVFSHSRSWLGSGGPWVVCLLLCPVCCRCVSVSQEVCVRL